MIFTAQQIAAIIGLLMAFGVPQANIDAVKVDLGASTITLAPSYQEAPVQIPTPVFGNTQTLTITPLPMPTPSKPNYSIAVSVSNPVVQVGVGRSVINVAVHDKNGMLVKKQVVVTTNDPDLPSTFTINATLDEEVASNGKVGATNGFCVAPPAPGTTVYSGCSGDGTPVSVGTWDFTFTSEDATASTQVQVTP